jgi:hypothetical protein
MAQNPVPGRRQTLPPELLRSAPRPVGLTPAGVALVFVALAALAGSVAAAVGLSAVAKRDAERARLLPSEARTTAATVTRVRRRGNEGQVTFDYRYVAEGHERTGRGKVRKRDPLAARIAEGDSLTVRYLASEPGRSWLDGHQPKRFPFWLPAAAAAMLAIGPAVIATILRRQHELLENGRAALAQVTATKKVRHSHGGTSRVEYEWNLLSGARARSRYDTDRKAPAVGSVVPIVYDPDQPRRSALYPLRLVRVKEL